MRQLKFGRLLSISSVILLASSLLYSIATAGDRRDEAAANLLGAFQGGCVSSGKWTEAALANTQALISILKDLKEKNACKAVTAQIAEIESLSTQVNALLKDPAYADYRLAEEKLQDLTLALGNASDPALSSSIGDEIVLTQLGLAEKRARNRIANELDQKDRFAVTTQMIGSRMQSLLQNMNGISDCLQQSPQSAIQIANNFIGMAGSFVSPLYGAAASTIAQAVNLGIEYARNSRINKSIWELHAAQMPIALGCGMESMTELYCSANDAFSLLELSAQENATPGLPPEPIWRGLDLVSRRMPVLDQWLLSVKNGVLPTDSYEAQRQNEAWKKLSTMDEIYRNVYANLNHGRQKYDAAVGKPSIQTDILVSIINETAELLTASENYRGKSTNPFGDKSTDRYNFACWLSLGLIESKNCPQRDTQNESFELYIRNKLAPSVTIPAIFLNWESLYSEVKTQIDIEFAETITADPASLLAAGREAPANNLSPRSILEAILSFLDEAKKTAGSENPQLPRLIKDTKELVENAIKILNTTDEGAKPLDQIRNLFTLFDLQHGLQFFHERINNFVEWDLQFRLRKGELPNEVSAILRSAGGDIKKRLVDSGVSRNMVKQDLDKSRYILEQNIASFTDFFDSSIRKSMKLLSEGIERSGEPRRGPNRPNGSVLAHLCVLTLAAHPQWPKDIPWKYCENAVLESLVPDPSGELTIELQKLRAELEDKPSLQRMCAYHRYIRASKLSEIIHESEIRKPISLLSTVWTPDLYRGPKY